MTKKDFQAFADIINKLIDDYYSAAWRVAEDMADYFETRNPRFDRGRFFEACGLMAVEL